MNSGRRSTTGAKTGEYPRIFPNDIPQFLKPTSRIQVSIKINVRMAERFAFVTEEEIHLLVDRAVPENTKKSTSYAINVFDGKLFVNRIRHLYPHN